MDRSFIKLEADCESLRDAINNFKNMLQHNLHGTNDFGAAIEIIKEGGRAADNLMNAKIGNDLWNELKALGCKASLNSEISNDNMIYNLDEPFNFRDRLIDNGYVYSKGVSNDDSYSIYRNNEKGIQIFMTCNNYLKISYVEDVEKEGKGISDRITAAREKASIQKNKDKGKVANSKVNTI